MKEKELWETFKKGKEQTADTCPDILELAAYMDKQLDEKRREEVETHLNRCEECLENTLALFKVQQEIPRSIPLASANAAHSLVGENKHPADRRRQFIQGAAASLLFLLASLSGYRFGTDTGAVTEYALQAFLDEDLASLSSAIDGESILFDTDFTGDIL